jgi:hypothetical protein
MSQTNYNNCSNQINQQMFKKWFISHIQAEEKQGEIRSERIGHATASGAG